MSVHTDSTKPSQDDANKQSTGRWHLPHDERLMDALGIKSTRARLTLAFLLVVLVTALLISVGAIGVAVDSGRQQIKNQLQSVAVVKQGIIDTWLDGLDATLASMLSPSTHLEDVHSIFRRSLIKGAVDDDQQDLREHLEWMMAQTEVFDEVFLMDARGRSVLSTDLLEEGKIHINQIYFTEGLKGPYVSAPFYSPSQQRLSIVATRPIVDEQGNRFGVIGGRASMDKLSEIMQEQAGLGETGETYLVGANHGLLTSAKGRVVTDDAITYVRNDGVNRALDRRQSDSEMVEDFRGIPVAGHYQWVPRLNVLLVAEQDRAEAFRPIYWMLGLILAISLLAILAVLAVSLFISRRITTPLIQLADAATQVESENFNPDDLDLDGVAARDDELGQLARVFESMAQSVYKREQRLKQRVQELEIVIDESKRQEQVSELTESDFFRDLTQKAAEIRDSRRSSGRNDPPPE